MNERIVQNVIIINNKSLIILSPMGLFRDNETNKFKWKNNKVKNPNEANQLAIYKRGLGFELGTMKNKSS